MLAGGEASGPELEGMAERLGCDLDADHLVVHVEPWRAARPVGRRRAGRAEAGVDRRGWRDLAGQIETRLDARVGALCDRGDGSLHALVSIAGSSPGTVLDVLREMAWSGQDSLELSVGVSDVCRGRSAFPRGFEEAAAAATVGPLMGGKPGVTTFEELGSYRYVLSIPGDDARDPAQHRLGLLVEYDRRRGTQLLDTLEGYLDHRGNVVGTSRALFIHPNTLRQRLDRIQHESGIDLEHDDWLSIAVATKVVKLARMRGSAGREGGKDG
jgi:hypothetical protein